MKGLALDQNDSSFRLFRNSIPLFRNDHSIFRKLHGRQKKKNAGEVSITILAEIISWYYPNPEMITVYSQDSDTKMFQNSADEQLRKVFSSRIPVPVSFKSNDVILCQLFRDGAISEEDIRYERKSERKITYSKALEDKSVVLVF